MQHPRKRGTQKLCVRSSSLLNSSKRFNLPEGPIHEMYGLLSEESKWIETKQENTGPCSPTMRVEGRFESRHREMGKTSTFICARLRRRTTSRSRHDVSRRATTRSIRKPLFRRKTNER